MISTSQMDCENVSNSHSFTTCEQKRRQLFLANSVVYLAKQKQIHFVTWGYCVLQEASIWIASYTKLTTNFDPTTFCSI